MKKIFVTIFISIIFLGSSNFLNKADAKEITNLQWKKSVAKGKKLTKFRETVSSPALGEKAWKITLLPRDCGRDQDGDYSDCTNNGRDAVVGHGGGDRARSEYSAKPRYTGEKWISVSIFIPKDFKTVEPVSTSLFQIYEWGNTNQQRHPRMMLRVKRGNLEPRYFAVNGMDSQGLIYKHLKIDDMRASGQLLYFIPKCLKIQTKDLLRCMWMMYSIMITKAGRVMVANFLINLEFIIAGLVDGTMKYMENTQLKLFTMTIFLEQAVKKNF